MKKFLINLQTLKRSNYALTLVLMLVAFLFPQTSWAQWAETPKNTDGRDIEESVMKKIVNDGNITLVTAIENISQNQYQFEYTGATSYSSSNTSVAWIGEAANFVNIAGAGTTTITATVGENTYSYTLIVNEIAFKSTITEVILNEPTSLADKVSITPTPSETAPLEFSTSGTTSIATINNDALTLTGTKLGVWSDALRVNFKNEGNYVPKTSLPTCSLKVVPPAPTIVPETANVYTYDEGATATISMPETITEEALGGYSAVIKYKYNYGEEESDEMDYNVSEGVGFESSCRLIAWIEIIDVQNNNSLIAKSAETSADFVIRQDPGLYFEDLAEPVQITIGETLTAPTIKSGSDDSWTPTVTWSCDETAIATVDETTGVVTPVSASDETVTITATFAGDDTYSASTATYTVKVNKASDYFTIIEDGQELGTTALEATIGQTLSISEAITLSYPEGLQLTWDCNNNSSYNNGINDDIVAQIDNSGNLTATGYGVATVKITANKDEANTNYTEDEVEINVFVKPQAPSVTPENGIYYLGQKITVKNAEGAPDEVKANLVGIGNDYEGSQQVEYTPESQGIHYGVKAFSSITRTITTTSTTYSRNSEEILRNYVFCNTPVISSQTNDGTTEVTITCTGIEDLPQCKIMYYFDNGDPILYNNDNKPTVNSSSTLYAFIRYTNSDDPTEIFNSTPVSKAFIVPEMSFAEKTAEVTYGSTLNSPTLTKPESVNVTYSSSDETIAIVNAETGVVTPVKVGSATITATSIPIEDFIIGTATYTLTVTAKTITDDMVVLTGLQNPEDNSVTYSGSLQIPDVTVTGLTGGTDYTITNEGGTNKGTYDIIVTGKDNYTGNVTKKFRIHPLRLSSDSIVVNGIDPQTFTGAPIIPELTIYYTGNGAELEKDTHYTIEGVDNTNVNTEGGAIPTLTLTAIDSETNNFCGTTTVTFDITQADLGNVTIDDIETIAYDGDEHKPTLSVTLNSNAISSEDYTVSYTKGETAVTEVKDAGKYTVILTSSNKNFTEGSIATKDFEISAATASITADNQEVTYNIDAEVYEYDMSKVTKSPTSLTEEDFSLTYYEEDPSSAAEDPEQLDGYPTSAGTYFVKIELINPNYQMTPVVKTLTINPKVLTDEMITITPESTVYSGNLQTPTVTVMDGETSLEENDNYTLTNNGGTSANDYDVVVIGKGNYSGTITKTFSITAKEVTGAIVTLDEETNFVYDGTAKTPTVNKVAVLFEGATEETVFNADTDYDVSYSEGCTDVGEYTVTVTFKGNYSGTATANFTISRDLDITFAENQTWASYYATEDLVIPEGLTAYIVSSADKSTGTVTTTQIDYIPKNQAVLLNNPNGIIADSFIADPYPESAPGVTGNLLQGSENAININTITTGTVYILYNDEFRRATSGTIPARRAYLVVSGSAHARLRVTSNGTTDINDSIIEDNSDNWYNLDGRKFDGQPKKPGLYINNGKKVFIKK